MSKFGIYVIYLAMSVLMFLTIEADAQQKKLSEIMVELDHKSGPLMNLISEMEEETEFTFAYLDPSLQDKQVSLNQASWQMEDLLKEISVQAKVSLRRVNASIAIIDEGSKEFPDVEEVEARWSISGSVMAENDSLMQFVNATLLNAHDSSLVKGSITNDQGHFRINGVYPGHYILNSSLMGFSKNYSPVFEVVDGDVTIETIKLRESIQELDRVVIEADKPLFERRPDRLILNVKGSSLMSGATIPEILGVIPTITLLDNKVIHLNGKSGVTIMINGKPLRMAGEALYSYMKNMPAHNVEKVEVITAPPTKHSADGNTGFINIITKDHGEEGISGLVNVVAGHGERERFLASSSLKYRRRKLGIFTDFSYRLNRTRNILDDNNVLHFSDDIVNSESKREELVDENYYSTRMGVEYELGKKTTVGLMADFFWRERKSTEMSNSSYKYMSGIDTLLNTKVSDQESGFQYFLDFNLTHHLAEGHTLEVNANHLNFIHDQQYQYHNQLYPQNTSDAFDEDLLFDRTAPFSFWSGSLDYNGRIGSKIEVDAGIKADWNKATNNVFADIRSSLAYPNFSFDSHLDEKILAGYGAIKFSFGKTAINSGLRYERTTMDVHNDTDPVRIKSSYGNFFPSFFLSRILGERATVNFSYTSRINRPSWMVLSPTPVFITPRTLRYGRTTVTPAITHMVSLSWSWNRFLLSMDYSRDSGSRAGQPQVWEGQRILMFGPVIFDYKKAIGLRADFPLVLAEWWEMNHVIGIYHQGNATSEYSEFVEFTANNFNYNSVHRFKFGRNYSAELLTYYSSGWLWGLRRAKSRGGIDIGFKKEFENNGTLSLNLTDIFRTDIYRAVYDVPAHNIHRDRMGYSDKRVIRISYSQTFGNGQIKSGNKGKNEALRSLGNMDN